MGQVRRFPPLNAVWFFLHSELMHNLGEMDMLIGFFLMNGACIGELRFTTADAYQC